MSEVGRTRKTILLADRDGTTLLFERMLLGEDVYDFLTATTIREAVAIALEHAPDLILLDETMPDCSGLNVCRAFREARRRVDVPIIVVSTTSDPEFERKAKEAGCSGYIRKPFNARELQKVVREHLEVTVAF